MKLNQLGEVVAALEQTSIRSAARTLKISPPALTETWPNSNAKRAHRCLNALARAGGHARHADDGQHECVEQQRAQGESEADGRNSKM